MIAPFYAFYAFAQDGRDVNRYTLGDVPFEIQLQISKIIKEIFPGYSILESDLANTVLPDISLPRMEMGEVTVEAAIFTDHTI